MKGSNGKKKRSKQAFALKQKLGKKKVKEIYLLNKLKKWKKYGWIKEGEKIGLDGD